MINLKKVKKYCPEHYAEIQNYAFAIADEDSMWICHHVNGEQFDRDWLILNNMYYNRTDPREFKFVLKSEHEKIHAKQKLSNRKLGPLSDKTKAKLSKVMSGKNNPFYGKTHTKEVRERMKAHKDKTKAFIARRTDAWRAYEGPMTYQQFIKEYKEI